MRGGQGGLLRGRPCRPSPNEETEAAMRPRARCPRGDAQLGPCMEGASSHRLSPTAQPRAPTARVRPSPPSSLRQRTCPDFSHLLVFLLTESPVKSVTVTMRGCVRLFPADVHRPVISQRSKVTAATMNGQVHRAPPPAEAGCSRSCLGFLTPEGTEGTPPIPSGWGTPGPCADPCVPCAPASGRPALTAGPCFS